MSQEMPDRSQQRYVFCEGDLALLIDRKGRRYMLSLEQGKSFQSHIGVLPHTEIIGREEGCRVVASGGQRLLVLKPTMADFILEMPRIAQVIYPKDIGAILTYGDIFPGAHVLEAGMGSGALTIALLRAVGEKGHVVSYDIRPDMMERAKRNIHSLLSPCDNLSLKLGDVYEGFEERNLDRLVLDLPEPWQVVPLAAEALVPGGLFLSYLPTILQVHQLSMALREHPSFDLIETLEVLVRPWSVTARSVRPVHRMVAHTGFITTARNCSDMKIPGQEQPREGL